LSSLAHIRAVALDFDGTLLEMDGSICSEARAAILAAAAAGVRVATASGRSLAQQIDFLAAGSLGVAARVPHALTVDERSVWLLDGHGYEPLTAWNDRVDAEWARLHPVAVAVGRDIVAELRARGVDVAPSMDPESVARRGQFGLRFRGEAEALAHRAWLAEFVAAHSDELVVSQNWMLVHILPRAAGKGHTLAALARAWQLAPSEMLAVGDRHNDVPMLDGALGLGAACVGNAVDDIKALVRGVGGYVATADTGAGVAEILEKVLADRA